ncbi:Hypothetical protein GLP15_5149 [Giardia lamblia P15]|uniref:Uncharacterized protein n=1 Tax=Giardia intestinalis (strain P15) TaxID=658858 RepID=E1EW81_GIAIA|nr:Hypothetical protein GLP15_5149 [Giardia lamblia P15]
MIGSWWRHPLTPVAACRLHLHGFLPSLPSSRLFSRLLNPTIETCRGQWQIHRAVSLYRTKTNPDRPVSSLSRTTLCESSSFSGRPSDPLLCPYTASMIIRKAERKGPFSERPNRSFSARDMSTVVQTEPDREQLLRLQPVRGDDSISLLGLRTSDQKRYVMPSQIVLNEHIYSDDKNVNTKKPRVLISNYSRRTVTLPRVMYCNEGYSTTKYNVLHAVNQWKEKRKGSLLPVAGPIRQTLLGRSPPILVHANKLPGPFEETTDGSKQEISTIIPQPKGCRFHRKETHNREIQKHAFYALKSTALAKRAERSMRGTHHAIHSMDEKNAFTLQLKQPLIMAGSLILQDMHEVLEAQEEIYTDAANSCPALDRDTKEGFSHEHFISVEPEKSQLLNQPTNVERASILSGASSPDCCEENASQTESPCVDMPQYNSSDKCEPHLYPQTRDLEDTLSQSNPTQSETIYGNILSFEKRLLPESGNDSFVIHPLHYYTSEDIVLQSRENSESVHLSSISLPLLETDTPMDTSSDTSDHLTDQPVDARPSYDVPISPVVSRVPTATSPPTRLEQRSSRTSYVCMSPPLAVKPSIPPSKLLTSQHALSSPPQEELIHKPRALLQPISASSSTHMRPGIPIRGRIPKRLTLYNPPTFCSQMQQAGPKASRLQERGAQNYHWMPGPIKLAGLTVHSLVALEPIPFHSAAQLMSTRLLAPPAPCVSIPSELQHTASQTDVHGAAVPLKPPPPINVGMSRYPPRLRAFIKASASGTKTELQRPHTKVVPSTLLRRASDPPRLHRYKMRSASAYVPRSEPLRPDLLSFRPRTAPALGMLSPHSPAHLKLLYNTPMTVTRENVVRSVKDAPSPYVPSDIRVFPEDLSGTSPADTRIECQTPHASSRVVRSVYAPMKLPTKEKQISTICKVVSARTNALTEEDMEDIKQIFHNTSHDSMSSPYAQHLVTPDQQNCVRKLFNDIRKDAEIRRIYGIDRVKRGLNMELYKRIKYSDGDAVIHKVRGLHPDTDSSAPDGFEPPDFRELTTETTSPQDATAEVDRNLRAVKAFLYTPSSSPLEESLPTDHSKEAQHGGHHSPQARNLTEIMASTPTNNPMINVLKQSLGVTPNRLLTTPLPNLRGSKALLPSRPYSSMMLDYVTYLQVYTPKLRAPPEHHHVTKSAPLNAATYDSHLTKLLKEGLNRQRCASFGISRPISCAPSCTSFKKLTRLPISARTTSKVDTGSSQIALDDHECLTSAGRPIVHNHFVEPVIVLQADKEVTKEARDDEVMLDMLINDDWKQAFEDPHRHQNLGPASLREASTEVFAGRGADTNEAPVQSLMHPSDRHITDTLEELPPDPPPDKHDGCPRRRAVAGDKTVSNRKACRRFYKEAIIDRDVSRIYRTYAQYTAPRLCPLAPARLNYERLLSRPLTVTKETIAKNLAFYQTDMKKITPVTPLFTDRTYTCNLQ